LKEVASKTGDDAGDGTTTATVLAQAIVAEGLKNVTAGAHHQSWKQLPSLVVHLYSGKRLPVRFLLLLSHRLSRLVMMQVTVQQLQPFSLRLS